MAAKQKAFSAAEMQSATGPGVRRRRPVKKGAEGPVSLGYPTIERLIETEQLDEMRDGYGRVSEELKEIVDGGDRRKAREAEKVQKAFDRGVELVDHLLGVKQDMLKQANK